MSILDKVKMGKYIIGEQKTQDCLCDNHFMMTHSVIAIDVPINRGNRYPILPVLLLKF